MAQEPPAGFPPGPPPFPPDVSPPPPPGGSGWGTPWDRRAEIGLGTALIETTKEVLTGPGGFFGRMPVTGGIGSPLLYGVILGYLGILIQAVYSSILQLVGGFGAGAFSGGPFGDQPELARFMEIFEGWGGIIGQVVFGPFSIVIGLFVAAGIIHLMLLLLDGAGQGFEATFRVLCFSHAANVLAVVPLCGGFLAGVYGIVLWIIGLAAAHRIPAWKAAVAVLLPIVLCCCCCLVGVGMMAGGIASMVQHAQ